MLPALAAFLFAPLAVHAEGPPRQLGFREAIEVANRDATEVRIADRGVEGADARVDAVRAQLLPKLRTEGNAFVWDDALTFNLGSLGSLGGISIPPTTMRERFTSSFSVTIAQPLTPLFVLFDLLDVEKKGRDVAESERSRARLDAVQRAAEAHLRALQARAYRDVAEKSLRQVEAQLERARSLEKAGVLGRVDVLRLEAARASASQGTVRARAGVTIADRALALAVNLGEDVEAVDDLPKTPPPRDDAARLGHAETLARRPELDAARARVLQAEAGRSAVRWQFLPSIVALGTYQHTEGMGSFQPANAAFAGATLTWDAFEWGRTFDLLAEASSRAEQAKLAFDVTGAGIAFDVERRRLELDAAYEMLAAAESGAKAAEEAHRIQSVRFAQGDATTTDVLDAETELARSRVAYASSRYDYYIAIAAMARSEGRLPTELIETAGSKLEGGVK